MAAPPPTFPTLENIVNVVITTEGRGVSRRSFGIPLVVGKHDVYGDLVRVYNLGTAPADLVSDGFVAGSPIHRAVSALARNTPKARQVAVGRVTQGFVHQFSIEVLSAAVVENKVISFDVVAPNGGDTTNISYTVLSGDTETDIAVALAALIDAIVGIGVSPPGGSTLTAQADNGDEQWYIQGLDPSDLVFTELTPWGVSLSDFDALEQAYPDFYGLIFADPNSKDAIEAIAGWIETKEKIFGYTTHDGACLDASSFTDVMYTMNAAQYFRSFGIYSGDQGKHAVATWMGNRFPIDAGASTWAYKPLSGVIPDVLTAAMTTAIADKKGNYYQTIAGLPVTIDGKMASGEWIDVIRGRDWLTARLRERIFGLLANTPKVPYTDPGVEQIVAQVDAQLKEGIGQGYLAADPPPIVTAPLVADVSSQDKIDRILPDVNFEATLAGAIHVVDPLNGVLKV